MNAGVEKTRPTNLWESNAWTLRVGVPPDNRWARFFASNLGVVAVGQGRAVRFPPELFDRYHLGSGDRDRYERPFVWCMGAIAGVERAAGAVVDYSAKGIDAATQSRRSCF